MKNILQHKITRYQSGTTWINFDGYDAGFHLGYFDGVPQYKQKLQSRSDIARNAFISVISNGLNAINNKPKDFVSGQYPYAMIIGDTFIKFIDSFYGNILLNYQKVESGGEWKSKKIPKQIKTAFEQMFEHLKYCNKTWED